ncbi:MAG: ferric reductase-like transmembrane domain-containing protein [Candidatus Methanoperedens sp.]
MKKNLILFLIFFVSFIPCVHAHTLRVDGSIGVLMHADPNDAPVAGQVTSFFVNIQDNSGKFNISACNCTLAIEKDSREIAAFPITSNGFHQQIEYSFPASGIYKAIVVGKPATVGEFQSFKTTFEYYVSGNLKTGNEPDANPLQDYFPLIVLIAGLAILAMLVPNRKPSEQEKEASRISGKNIYGTLVPYSRGIVYILAIIWACLLYYYVSYTIPDEATALYALARYYGLTALFMVFLVLIPGMVSVYFPRFAFNELLIYSRRALGISTFFFALFHSIIDYFYSLSGSIQFIYFLSEDKLISIIFSIIAFFVIFLMAITSFDKVVAWMGYKKWKFLHRFIYPAAILILFHTFMIGAHFINPHAPLPLFVICLALAFVLLEVGATAKILMLNKNRNVVYYAGLAIIVISAFYISFAVLVALSSLNVQQNLPNGEYAVKGSVVFIDNETNDITVRQEEIPGVIPGMVMIYNLDDLNGTRIDDFVEGENVTLILMRDPKNLDFALIRITKA